MKKFIAKIVTFILATTMVLSIFTACDWVTTNADRDMEQVIASINIDDSKLDDAKLYKRELVANYVSYGYQYVTSYGYTVSDAYELLLDNLVNNEVILQFARIKLADTYASANGKDEAARSDFEKLFLSRNHVDGNAISLKYAQDGPIGIDSAYVKNLKQYITPYEFASILYASRVYVNSMIDSYEDAEKDEEEDPVEDVTYTARAVPTVDADPTMTEIELESHEPDQDEYEIANVTLKAETIDALKAEYANVFALNSAVYEKYSIDFNSTRERRKAYTQMLTFLKDNGLVNSETTYDVEANKDDVFKYDFFYNVLVERLEAAVISKYENSLRGDAEKDIENGLWDQYLKEYGAQEAAYRNDNAAYETALEAVSDTSFVLYNPNKGADMKYGYVANLLIGFNDAQSALLTDYSAKQGVTKEQIAAYREQLLNGLVATDQRATWVQSSYGDYDKDSGKFAFGAKYRTSDLANLNEFIGDVSVVNPDGTTKEDDNGVEKTTWSFKSVTPTEIPFDTFYATYVEPVIGSKVIYKEGDDATIATVSSYDQVVFEKFEDLMFAFSTDPGCLNKEYGYLYSPVTSATTYVEEFAAASKAVVNKGVGAYTIVATDYGYHIILCTGLVSDPYTADDDGKTAFTEALATVDSLAYNYKKVKTDAVVSTRINKIVQTEITPFITEDDDAYAITYFEKAYDDLIIKEDADDSSAA